MKRHPEGLKPRAYITGIKTTHEPKWSSKSLALFFGFVAVFLVVVSAGILTLPPFSPGVNYGILVGFLLAMGGVFWWKRYSVLMLIRRLERKFGGEKKIDEE